MLYGPLTRRLRDAQMVSAVLAVAGPADAAPVDEAGRAAYCGYVAGVLRSYPQIGDVVIWTEPNSARFWKPVSPQAYAALLSACYALLHAARPGVNVIGASAARGTIPPATFWKRVGAAADALDTVGHNPYPADPSEDPGAHGLVVRYLLNALDGRDPAPLLDGVPCAEPYELKAPELERAVDRLEAWTWDPRW